MLCSGWSHPVLPGARQRRIPARSRSEEPQMSQACADPICGPMEDAGEIRALWSAGL